MSSRNARMLLCMLMVPFGVEAPSRATTLESDSTRIGLLKSRVFAEFYQLGEPIERDLDPGLRQAFAAWRDRSHSVERWQAAATECSLAVFDASAPDTILWAASLHLTAAAGRWLASGGDFTQGAFVEMMEGLSSLWDEWVLRLPETWHPGASWKIVGASAAVGPLGVALTALVPREGSTQTCERIVAQLARLPARPYVWMAVLAWDRLMIDVAERAGCIAGGVADLWEEVERFEPRTEGEDACLMEIRERVRTRRAESELQRR